MTNILLHLSDLLSGLEMRENETNHKIGDLRDKIYKILRLFISSHPVVFGWRRRMEEKWDIILRHFDASEPELIDSFIEEDQDIDLKEHLYRAHCQ